MKLIYATTNMSKIHMMEGFLKPLGIEISGLKGELPDVLEVGNQPLDNARQKARAYYDLLKTPLFSCDSGLFIEGIPDHFQPGTNVRHVGGRRLNDEEMIVYYSSLAQKYGRKEGNSCVLTAQYKNAICLILGKEIVEYDGEDLSGERFFISSTPHCILKEGFPMDSLSINIATKTYYYDLPSTYRGFSMQDGFCAFFKRSLKL